MNRADLVAVLQTPLRTRKEAGDALDALLEAMRSALRAGDKVVLSGFGSFHPFTTRPKRGRNPATGEKLAIPPRRKVRFRLAKDFF